MSKRRLSRYERVVPKEVRDMAAAAGWGVPNAYVSAGAAWPYYPESVLKFLGEHYGREDEDGESRDC